MARKKNTPDRIKTILEVIGVGGTDKDAYTVAGISAETFYEWMKQPSFSEQVQCARAQGKVERLKRIKNHAGKDWRADAWYLERRYPDEYAQHLIIKATPSQAAMFKAEGLTLDEAWAQFVAMFEAEMKANADHAD
jgi:hypothetical protein